MVLSAETQSSIEAILSSEEIILPSSPRYTPESQCWAFQKDLKPAVVLRPNSLPSLQRTVKYLCDSNLDFGVRSGGVGSSSGRDAVLSVTAFDRFEFDAENETVIIGSGQLWGDVDRKMEKEAPGYAVVGARVPYVGVGGSVLGGGFSWLSHEFGLTSDPSNLLDAEVVLPNGELLWASSEPELLWALRGGGGNFGVVTAFKLKAYRYTQSIFAGYIIFPPTVLEIVSQAVSDFTERIKDPKIAMHVYILNPDSQFVGKADRHGIALMVYDANGVEHGRSEMGFKWALDIEGAIDVTKGMTLFEVHQLTASTSVIMGKMRTFSTGILVPTIDPGFIIRASDWLRKTYGINKDLTGGTYVLLEIMQEGALNSAGSTDATAYPHAGHGHVLLVATGLMPDSNSSDELAIKLLQESFSEIDPSRRDYDYFPNIVEDFVDVSKVYGPNYAKLGSLKAKCDPRGRLNKGIYIPPAIQ